MGRTGRIHNIGDAHALGVVGLVVRRDGLDEPAWTSSRVDGVEVDATIQRNAPYNLIFTQSQTK